MPERFLAGFAGFLEDNHILQLLRGLRPYVTRQVMVIGVLVIGTALILGLTSMLTFRRRPNPLFRLAVLAFYLYGNFYFTLLNRDAVYYDRIQEEAFHAYRQSLYFDYGPLQILSQLLHADWSGGLSGVHVIATEPLEGILLNILLYIPLGYLLPYAVGFFARGFLLYRTLLAGFALSLATEMIQLRYHLGWFDLDDVFNNTLGTLIGMVLYAVLFLWADRAKRKRQKGLWKRR